MSVGLQPRLSTFKNVRLRFKQGNDFTSEHS
jgi:hypothetical protein